MCVCVCVFASVCVFKLSSRCQVDSILVSQATVFSFTTLGV